ncbi:MAG TPA: sulfotransferase [Solirubrobacteraceae bacterium]|nr:sulfotransferase [Solirubrobacteraceae bacterium]
MTMSAEPAQREPAGAPSGGRGAAAAAGRRFPDFYIVGHGKCGTTALYRMLLAHPQIHMPVKEPRYFAPDRRTRYWRPAASMRKHPDTLAGYLALYADAPAGKLVGEASPTYLRSTLAARNIAAVRPDARIVAILREPASLLRSVHLQALRNYDETEKDFAKALALEDARKRGRRIPLLSQFPEVLLYSELIRYTEQLRRYHELFGREQVLVLIYDDFRADNAGTVRQVLRFLGLDDSIAIPQVELESLRHPRSVLLDQAARATTMIGRSRLGRGPSRALAALTPRALGDSERLAAAWRRLRFVETPPADERLMLELRRRFKDEVQAVSDHLGRDLVSLWGYDRLD